MQVPRLRRLYGDQGLSDGTFPMQNEALNIVSRIQQAGHTAYYAGGCVRDTLRGEEPDDYDIATSATPAEVEQLFPKTRMVGAHFGVVLVSDGEHQIEVATARARGLTGADIRFVDVTDEFDNHGACRFWQRDRFVNDAVFGDSFRRSQLADGTVREHWTDGPFNVSTASFHPSSKGYDAYLDALRTSLPPELLPTR